MAARHHFSIRKSRHYAGPQRPKTGFRVPHAETSICLFRGAASKQTTTAPHAGQTHAMGACSARRGMIAATRSPATRETLCYCSGYLLCRFLEIRSWQGLACPDFDNNLTPPSYPNAGPDTEAGLVPVGPLECLSPCRRDARRSG